jgi:soluble lytic murein transglycosylase-like protein
VLGAANSALGAARTAADAVRTALLDTLNGLFEVAHNGFAVIGLFAAAFMLGLAANPELRTHVEQRAHAWLSERQIMAEATGDADTPPSPGALSLTAEQLPRAQAAVTAWLSSKYRVAQEPVGRLVQEAWEIGDKTNIDPTLILAIMAVESGFNPFAQSSMGAQGLMQVMTKVHADKYVANGGAGAVFDPVVNLRVGVLVLQEHIRRAGSLEGGLRQYVGASTEANEGGYTTKVLAEQARLQAVALGQLRGRPNAQVADGVRSGTSRAIPAAASTDLSDKPAKTDAPKARDEQLASL